jgi:hypothetical protein
MVLQHVADRADVVVKRAATLHAEILGHGDLHALDVVAVPHRLEHGVGEAEIQQVLHRLLAEVVIDAEDRLFGKHLMQVALSAWPRPDRGQTAFPPRRGRRPRSRTFCRPFATTPNRLGGIAR